MSPPPLHGNGQYREPLLIETSVSALRLAVVVAGGCLRLGKPSIKLVRHYFSIVSLSASYPQNAAIRLPRCLGGKILSTLCKLKTVLSLHFEHVRGGTSWPTTVLSLYI